MMRIWLCLLTLLCVPLLANAVITVRNSNQASVQTSANSYTNTGFNQARSKKEEDEWLKEFLKQYLEPPDKAKQDEEQWWVSNPSRRDALDRAVRISWAAQSAVRGTDVRVAHVFYATRTSDIQVILRLSPSWRKPVGFHAGVDSFVVLSSARDELRRVAQDIFRTIGERKIRAGDPDQHVTLTFIQRWPGRKDIALYRRSVGARAWFDQERLAMAFDHPTGVREDPWRFSVTEFRRSLRMYADPRRDGDTTTSIGVINNVNFTTIH